MSRLCGNDVPAEFEEMVKAISITKAITAALMAAASAVQRFLLIAETVEIIVLPLDFAFIEKSSSLILTAYCGIVEST